MPEPIYSVEQIKIPQGFPDVLKNYSKFILHNQPGDLITASAEYFAELQRLSKSSEKKGPTTIQLEMLYQRFTQKNENEVDEETLHSLCQTCQISPDLVKGTLALGDWTGTVSWLKFWSLLCTSAGSDILATLELITPIIAGESGRVQTRLLADVFTYLAERDQTIPAKKIENAANELTAESYIHKLRAIDIFKAHLSS